MKKFFTLLFSLLTLIAYAQGDCVDMIRIQFHDGTHKDLPVSDLDEIDFITCDGSTMVLYGNLNGHMYVDLGLPSGTLWATCNVGAKSEEEYGDYFSWAETSPKDPADYIPTKTAYYEKETSTEVLYLKYNIGLTNNDGIPTLEASDDAATVNWGEGWRMPTNDDFTELKENTSWYFTFNYNNTGIAGMVFTGTKEGYTDISIFLPAAGYYKFGSSYDVNYFGYYWSASSNYNDQESSDTEIGTWNNKTVDAVYVDDAQYRYRGQSVRPVASKQ